MSVVECRNLKKTYGNINAVNDISFELGENKIVGLIGRNGAGKTTLLKLIAGFLRPTSGDIKVFSQSPFNNIPVSSNMIFIDDNLVFPAYFSLSDILKAAGRFYKNWDAELAERLLDYFSLNFRQCHNKLSKGMKSTFNTIIGIASHCPLTIFDEPTTGMDSAVRKDFYRALLKDYVEHPRIIILSSHLLNEIEDILEDILLLKDGTKCLHMPVLDLKEYAVGLRGNAGEIYRLIGDKQALYSESFAKENAYVVIRNDMAQPQIQQVKAAGINISAVPADDICVYLTAKTKGGINDVFNRG